MRRWPISICLAACTGGPPLDALPLGDAGGPVDTPSSSSASSSSGGDTAARLEMSLDTGEIAVPRLGSATVTATLYRINGYKTPITLTVDGLPSGVTADPVEVPDGATTATITFSAVRDAPKGYYEVAVYAGVALAAPLAIRVVSPRAGLLDSNFGIDGELDVDTGMPAIQEVVITPSVRILAVGGTSVARFMTDGTRDPTWSGGRNAVIGNGLPAPTAIAARNDGKVYLAGQPSLARLNDDGSFDTGFGTIALANGDPVAALAVSAPEGNLFALGDAPDHFSISKYTTNGTFVGQSTVAIAEHGPVHFSIRANEEVVVAAGKRVYRFNATTQDVGWTPVALDADAFDATGSVIAGAHATTGQFALGLVSGTTVTTSALDVPSGGAVTDLLVHDEGIYVAGTRVARFLGDGGADPTFGNGGVSTGDSAHADTPAVMSVLTSNQLLTVAKRSQPGTLIFRRYFL